MTARAGSRPTCVKICGITRPQDAALAAELGADLLGMVFSAASRRRVDLARAEELARASDGAARVGVFKYETLPEMLAAIERGRLSFAQLQRLVTADEVAALPVPVIAAIRHAGDADALPDAVLGRLRAVLLDDSEGAGSRSGWATLESRPFVPVDLFLAGGLDDGCVGDAIRRLRPDGVDVATGVESSLGIKDRGRMERFIAAVREADRAAR
ncbi:MAG TPA: phosphoribosylanthranilate isomerase [Thermoanaerobaculia bacterium]|nr:phosphoribosylanthranilate isomerase [Thermoanaerobaculia bacterium]